MAALPWFRVLVFTFVTLFSLVVLGVCAHIQYLLAGYMDPYVSFVPLGLGAGSLTVLSLPLFSILSNRRQRIFTSTIAFEAIWFFILWAAWIGTASDTFVGKAYNFPGGCTFDEVLYPNVNQICNEFTVVEAFSLANFFCAFIYYDVIVLYAIINAIRGRGVWTTSVKEAASGPVGPALVVQPQHNAAPSTASTAHYQDYGTYPTKAPLGQPYSAWPQGQFGTYPQQVMPQSPPARPYSIHPPAMQPGQNRPYSYTPPPTASPQQAVFTGHSSISSLPPPQPNYSAYPISIPQEPLPLPSGYQEQPIAVQQQTESPFASLPHDSHQTSAV